MLRMPLRMVRAGSGMPVAFPHLPTAHMVLGAPDYLTTHAGGFFIEANPRSEEWDEEGEEGEEEAGQDRAEEGMDQGAAGPGWTPHERSW